MRSRGILLRSVAAALAVGTSADLGDRCQRRQRRRSEAKVNQLADQLDNLENRLGQLDEDYGAAQDQKAALDQEIADSQAKIAQQQARLVSWPACSAASPSTSTSTAARSDLSPLFSNAAAYTEAEQKDSLSRLALDSGAGSTDEMLALAEDLAKEQASLSRKQQQSADLVATLDSKLAEAQQLQTEYEQKLSSAKAELGDADRAGTRAPRRSRGCGRDRQAEAGCSSSCCQCRQCRQLEEERRRGDASRWWHGRRRVVGR